MLNETLSLRGFSYQGSEQVLVVGGIIFDDYTIVYQGSEKEISRIDSKQSLQPPEAPERVGLIERGDPEILERLQATEERLIQRDHEVMALRRQVRDQQITIQNIVRTLSQLEAEVRRLASTTT
jgi:hypothetical protein